ncbi:hypothetical protein HOD30_03105 [Candidatus Peregrinibacteria bacterium]|jgi:hypothetical protein|nr:hypothetical protein [Candidatus Neomarinimicrobiota bacterium]MBT4384711.1 hypothetical protein [Candidatus Peregrinibacteria bacterium]MBT4632081.1 hypothetical protein [Candidatus Peregrinibacteria bacterium]
MPGSPEKWIDKETGASTEHAVEHAKDTKTALGELAKDVRDAIPARDTLSMASPHEVVKGETLFGVLKSKFKDAFKKKQMIALSYRYMLEQVDGINFLEIGDKIMVQSGTLKITRKAGADASKTSGKDVSVDLFPWLEPTDSTGPESLVEDEL